MHRRGPQQHRRQPLLAAVRRAKKALLSAFGVKFQPADRAKEGCKGKIEKKIVRLARVYSYSYSFRFQPWNYK
jgi:hypothetical protein